MLYHNDIGSVALARKIKLSKINFGGNLKLRIYGRLDCRSGKKMKRENRIFFASEEEALANGYRPCGHCMQQQYQKWKMTYSESR